MHQAGMTVEQMYPHYFKDAETGKSISILEASSVKATYLTVDYEIEQPYFDTENKKDNPDEINNSILNDSETNFAYSTCRWEDVIEQVELNSSIENGNNNEFSRESAAECHLSPTDTNTTLCYETPKESPQECQEDKGTQTLRSISIQTDTTHKINEKRSSPDIKNATARIKKPLRPPPGYDHIIPHNTITYNYNTSPKHEHPYRHVTNQTYINFPIMYPYQAQQYGYMNPYENPYWLSLQQMAQLGSKLSPEQQNFLQSLNYNNSNYSNYNPYYNNYSIQSNYPYQPYAGTEYSNQNYANMQYPQYYQNVAPEPQNIQPSPVSNVKANVNPAVPATNLDIESIPLPIGPCKIETDKSESKTEEIRKELLQEANTDNICEKNVIENAAESQKEQIVSSQPLPAAIEEGDRKTELNLRIENETSISERICTNCDASELESVYEDCTSNDSVQEESTILEDTTHKTKLITSMRIGESNLHLINHEQEYYFLLSELSKTLFGKTLTAFHIRKLMIGTPYIISVVDIRLKTNPKLKNELLMYDLIAENEVVVNAIPIKYLKDLTRMVTAAEEDLDHINDLLKGVDCFLTELNSENVDC